jgi:hypothetical protein
VANLAFMQRGGRTLWQKLAALVPLLLLLVVSPTQVLLRCRGDGQLRVVCCCPSSAPDAAEMQGSTLSRACCCDKELVGGLLPASDQRRVGSEPHTPPVFVALTSFFPAGPAQREVRPPCPERVRPAREGPSLLVLKQAFLI